MPPDAVATKIDLAAVLITATFALFAARRRNCLI